MRILIKRLVAVCLIMLFVMSCLPLSLADEAEVWICEVCGARGNTGKFCPECGAPQPEKEWTCTECGATGNTAKFCPECGAPKGGRPTEAPTPEPTPEPTPTPAPTATPTPEPTPEPTPAATLASYVSYVDGKTTISWTGEGTYYVLIKAVNGDAEQHSWNVGTSSTGSVTTGAMMPGKTYKVSLISSLFATADERTYTLPEVDDFQDGKLVPKSVKVSIETRSLAAGQPADKAKQAGLSATKMIQGIEDKSMSYGFKYQIKMPQLIKTRSFYLSIYIEAPNGYLDAEIFQDMTFERHNNAYETFWWYFLGSDYFEDLYETTGEIPQGTYTVTMFWDGMFMNQSTFKVAK